MAKQRWRIERDYQELKQQLDLSQFEGAAGAASIITRGYASLCTAAYGFLVDTGSIATLRLELAVMLIAALERRPCCGQRKSDLLTQ